MTHWDDRKMVQVVGIRLRRGQTRRPTSPSHVVTGGLAGWFHKIPTSTLLLRLKPSVLSTQDTRSDRVSLWPGAIIGQMRIAVGVHRMGLRVALPLGAGGRLGSRFFAILWFRPRRSHMCSPLTHDQSVHEKILTG